MHARIHIPRYTPTYILGICWKGALHDGIVRAMLYCAYKAGSHPTQGHYRAEESLAKCPTSVDKYG